MSAYVLPRERFVDLANFIAKHCSSPHAKGLHVYHPGNLDPRHRMDAVTAANALLNANLMSVAYRYKEDPDNVAPIRASEVKAAQAQDPLALVGVLSSLQYQSCERDDYDESLGKAVLISLLWKVAGTAAEQASQYEWA